MDSISGAGSQGGPRTLGDVLYGNPGTPSTPESEWSELVRGCAAGDVVALHRLYERAGRLVFVLAVRISGSIETAEEVTVEVFEDVWRRAWAYDAAEGTVLAWIMNQARTRARERVRTGAPAARLGEAAPDAGPETSDALCPRQSLQARLARRIANLRQAEPAPPPPAQWTEPEWGAVAPGISCKILARDEERERVSMLVRLGPDGEYPPHTHAGREELHLVDGELHIDGRTLQPGDYNRAEAPTGDKRVWSETGCTCVLVTSTGDKLG